MSFSISKATLLCFLILVLALPNFFIFATEQDTDLVKERGLLEEELKDLEDKIAAYENDITKTQEEKKTLENQIYILKTKIQKLDLQIQQSNTAIKDLGFQIKDTQGSIEETSLEIEDSKQKLAEILRLIYQEDQRPLIEILLCEKKLSDFFDNLMALETLNLKSKELLENIKNLKGYLQGQEISLTEEKEDVGKMLKIQILQRQESNQAKQETDWLLQETQGKESEYQELLTDAQKRAQEIRSRIFDLIGVPEAPTFGQAYEIAKYVTGATGIRPALLLAVLTQESNIGKNVGQCFLTDTETGQGKSVAAGKIEQKTMSPTRDLPHFLEICQELGRDPLNTPVSCPMQVGWGGAMGPSQFIPSTWVIYKDKIQEAVGHEPDPWDIKDAFMATGIYLKDLGAASDEFTAVMRYFSGYRWSKWEEFYGRSVIAIAKGYEQDILELEKAQ